MACDVLVVRKGGISTRSRASEHHTVGTATPRLRASHQLETRSRYFPHHGFFRRPMSTVTVPCLRSTDPIHDPSGLEVDDHQPATRAKCAENVSVDCSRIRQMVVNPTTKERITAGLGKLRARHCTLDYRHVQELRSCRCPSNVAKIFAIELCRIDNTRSAHTTCEGDREGSVSGSQVCYVRPGLYLEPRGKTLDLCSRRAVNDRQIRHAADSKDRTGRKCQASRNDPTFQARRHVIK